MIRYTIGLLWQVYCLGMVYAVASEVLVNRLLLLCGQVRQFFLKHWIVALFWLVAAGFWGAWFVKIFVLANLLLSERM